MMLLKRIAADRPKPGLAGQRLHVRWQAVEIQVVARQRPDQIAAAPFQHRLQRGRMRHVAFLEFAVVLGDRDVEPAVRDDAAFVDRVLVRDGAAKRIRSRARSPGNGNVATQRNGRDRQIARVLQLFRRPARTPSRRAPGRSRRREHSPDGSRVRRAGVISALPTFFSARPPRTASPCFAGHLDAVLEAQEIRRMQHHHVQRMALDPFAAIEQPAQRPQLAADGDAECVLHRMHRAHLIRDRTDAADARGDVRRLGEAAAAQQRLEQARRFEDRRASPT